MIIFQDLRKSLEKNK